MTWTLDGITNDDGNIIPWGDDALSFLSAKRSDLPELAMAVNAFGLQQRDAMKRVNLKGDILDDLLQQAEKVNAAIPERNASRIIALRNIVNQVDEARGSERYDILSGRLDERINEFLAAVETSFFARNQ